MNQRQKQAKEIPESFRKGSVHKTFVVIYCFNDFAIIRIEEES